MVKVQRLFAKTNLKIPVCHTRSQQSLGLHTPQQEHYQSPTNVRTLTPNSNEQRQGIIMAMVSCLLLFLTAYGMLGLVQQIEICEEKNVTNPFFISAYNARAEYGAHATPPPSPRGLAPSGDWGSNSGFLFIPQKILLRYLRCAWHPSHTSPRRSSLRILG